MKAVKVEFKIAKNGAKIFYVDGKRTSCDKAVKAQLADDARIIAELANYLQPADKFPRYQMRVNLRVKGGAPRIHYEYFNTIVEAEKALLLYSVAFRGRVLSGAIEKPGSCGQVVYLAMSNCSCNGIAKNTWHFYRRFRDAE